VDQQPTQEKSGEDAKSLELDYFSVMREISSGSFAGVIIGVVITDEIQNSRITVAILLPIAILMLSDYKGTRRVIRLIAAAIVAGLVVAVVLLTHAVPLSKY
jgi:hypothetical protein